MPADQCELKISPGYKPDFDDLLIIVRELMGALNAQNVAIKIDYPAGTVLMVDSRKNLISSLVKQMTGETVDPEDPGHDGVPNTGL